MSDADTKIATDGISCHDSKGQARAVLTPDRVTYYDETGTGR